MPHLGALHVRASGENGHEQKSGHEKTSPVEDDELLAILSGK